MIRPGVEVGAGSYTDGGVLYAERGDGVVEVVCVADFGNVRRLFYASSVQTLPSFC